MLRSVKKALFHSASVIKSTQIAASGPLSSQVFKCTLRVTLVEGDLKIPKIPEPVATHNQLRCTAEFRGFMPDHLDLVAYFARYVAHAMGIPTSKIIHLDTETEKWSMAKGPFVHGTTQEVFERKTHSRCVQLFDVDSECMQEWIQTVNEKLPAGVDFKVDTFDYFSVDEALEIAQQPLPKISMNFDEKVRQRAKEILDSLSK